MRAAAVFVQKLVVERPLRRRSPGIAGMLAKHGIGKPDVDPSWVVYEAGDYERAKQALLEAGLELAPPATPKVKPQAAIRPLPIGAGLVAARSMNAQIALPQGVRFMAMGWGDALSLRHEAIVICDSVAVLQQLPSYQWLDAFVKGREVLAVYRGGAGGFGLGAVDTMLREATAPVLAFVSYEPAGFAIAARLPRLEAVCLPPPEILRPLVAADGSSSQASAPRRMLQPELDKIELAAVARPWRAWKEQGRSLRAESFPRDRGSDRQAKGRGREGQAVRQQAAR